MFLIASAVSGLIAMGCLWAAISGLLTIRRQRAASVTTSGVVVALQKKFLNPGSGGVYAPTVEFRAPSGETIRFDASTGSMPAAHTIGQVVPVRYHPQPPYAADLDSGLTNWLVPGGLFAFAAGAGLFSLVFLGLYFLTSQAG
jgi:hypothetical protein